MPNIACKVKVRKINVPIIKPMRAIAVIGLFKSGFSWSNRKKNMPRVMVIKYLG